MVNLTVCKVDVILVNSDVEDKRAGTIIYSASNQGKTVQRSGKDIEVKFLRVTLQLQLR